MHWQDTDMIHTSLLIFYILLMQNLTFPTTFQAPRHHSLLERFCHSSHKRAGESLPILGELWKTLSWASV